MLASFTTTARSSTQARWSNISSPSSADIPAVLLRTDFRAGGDLGDYPWNLMSSFFPRTEVVLLNGMDLYQKASPLPPSAPAEEVLRAKGRVAGGVSARLRRWRGG